VLGGQLSIGEGKVWWWNSLSNGGGCKLLNLGLTKPTL